MTKKLFKNFMLLTMIFLLNISFIETITYAADQTSSTSSANNTTISSSAQSETSDDIKNTVSADDNLNKNSKDSSKDITNTNNKSNDKQGDKQTDTPNEQPTDQKGEDFIDYGWKIINNKKYYIVNNKILETTGWFMEKDINPNIKIDNKDYNNKYYLDKDFSVVKGWRKILGNWYNFDSEGVMKTGWILDNAWFYLDDSGVMQTGWKQIDGYTYYFDNYGQTTIGKKLIDNDWYFFNSKGRLEKGFYDYNEKTYYSDQYGKMVTNKWITNGDHRFYIKSDSSVAIGNIFINGIMENFDENGYYAGYDSTAKSDLYIQFLNVGNADCAFIQLPSGETVLIDTGDVSTTETLINFLNNQNLKTELFKPKNEGQAIVKNDIDNGNQVDVLQENAIIDNNTILNSNNTFNSTTDSAASINRSNNGKGVIDYVVLTHPHSDHIGGVIELLKNFNIGKIIIPKNFQLIDYSEGVSVNEKNESEINLVKYDYEIYTKTIDALAKSGVPIIEAKPESYIDSENILQFLNTNKDYTNLGLKNFSGPYWAINDNSAIVYLNYYDLQALFTGDMQWNSEKDFVQRNALSNKSVDILKVPHHGNTGSSSYSFVGYVNPTIGVISRAKASKNTTNEPYNTLTTCGVNIYETSDTTTGISVYATKDNWNVETK